MPKTREQQDRHNEYRRNKRRERGLQKQGRKPNTKEQSEYWKSRRKEYSRSYCKEYLKNNPRNRILNTARARAKRKGLEFSLELEDIIIPDKCPYLGVEMIPQAPLGTPRAYVMSLDRINPEARYVKGNVEVISWLANTMKNNATTEQLVQFAKAVLDRYD